MAQPPWPARRPARENGEEVAASTEPTQVATGLLRLAFVGKGGAGKSSIAGTLARSLARRGHPVLAVDSDPMPGLTFSLGLPNDDVGLPDDLVVERAEGEEGPRWRLRPGLDAAEAVERHAVTGPDGVRLLTFGKLRGTPADRGRSQIAFRHILDQLPDDRWSVVGDLPGGTRQPFFGWGGYARTVIVVVEPNAKSLLSGRRLARLALSQAAPERIVAVVNKARSEDDTELVRRRTGLDVIATVPWDEALGQADRLGLAPIDHAPGSPSVAAVGLLADELSERGNL